MDAFGAGFFTRCEAAFGCGVCVLGDVIVGHDSVIGSNAVVLADVPPCSVAVGVPARVVKRLKPATPSEQGDPVDGPPAASQVQPVS